MTKRLKIEELESKIAPTAMSGWWFSHFHNFEVHLPPAYTPPNIEPAWPSEAPEHFGHHWKNVFKNFNIEAVSGQGHDVLVADRVADLEWVDKGGDNSGFISNSADVDIEIEGHGSNEIVVDQSKFVEVETGEGPDVFKVNASKHVTASLNGGPDTGVVISTDKFVLETNEGPDGGYIYDSTNGHVNLGPEDDAGFIEQSNTIYINPGPGNDFVAAKNVAEIEIDFSEGGHNTAVVEQFNDVVIGGGDGSELIQASDGKGLYVDLRVDGPGDEVHLDNVSKGTVFFGNTGNENTLEINHSRNIQAAGMDGPVIANVSNSSTIGLFLGNNYDAVNAKNVFNSIFDLGEGDNVFVGTGIKHAEIIAKGSGSNFIQIT